LSLGALCAPSRLAVAPTWGCAYPVGGFAVHRDLQSLLRGVRSPRWGLCGPSGLAVAPTWGCAYPVGGFAVHRDLQSLLRGVRSPRWGLCGSSRLAVAPTWGALTPLGALRFIATCSRSYVGCAHPVGGFAVHRDLAVAPTWGALTRWGLCGASRLAVAPTWGALTPLGALRSIATCSRSYVGCAHPVGGFAVHRDLQSLLRGVRLPRWGLCGPSRLAVAPTWGALTPLGALRSIATCSRSYVGCAYPVGGFAAHRDLQSLLRGMRLPRRSDCKSRWAAKQPQLLGCIDL